MAIPLFWDVGVYTGMVANDTIPLGLILFWYQYSNIPLPYTYNSIPPSSFERLVRALSKGGRLGPGMVILCGLAENRYSAGRFPLVFKPIKNHVPYLYRTVYVGEKSLDSGSMASMLGTNTLRGWIKVFSHTGAPLLLRILRLPHG